MSFYRKKILMNWIDYLVIFYKHLLSIGILPDMVKDKQKEIADEFVNFLISEIKDPIHNQIVSIGSWGKKSDGSDIKKSYRSI